MSTAARPCPRCGTANAAVRYVEPPFRVVRCLACGLTYLANPPDETLLYEDYYAGSTPPPSAYAAHPPADADMPGLAELFAINTQRARQVGRLHEGGRLLDVGCGRGFFLKTARDHGFETAGIDVSSRAVGYAREAFDLDVRTATAADLLEAGERFDVVTLWHVLEHFLDPFSTLEEMRALLHDGGWCVVEVPNLHSLKFVLTGGRWEGGNHPRYHRTFFTARTLARALREAGFRSIRRLPLSYRIPGRSRPFEWSKRVLNEFALDAFLAFAAQR